MKYKIYDYDCYKIFTIKTNKFKNCYLEVNFRDDARNVNLTRRNFLGEMLAYTSKNYPSKREMVIRMEDLYNLSLSSDVTRAGYNLFTNFSIDFLNPKYVKEKDYLENAIAFLFDIIKNPHVENSSFNERSFEIIKERIKARLDSYKERPLSYAFTESKKRLFPNSITGKRIIGELIDLEQVTKENLIEEYESLKNSQCDILIIGDLDMNEVVSFIKKHFYKPSIVLENIPFTVNNKREKKQRFIEESTYKQTQLLMYYELEGITEYEKNFVLPIFQKILSSAGMADKLTKYLRMDKSLCYHCGATFRLGDNYAMIYVGLKLENVKEAKNAIHKALKEMETGQIEKSFFQSQKDKLLIDLKMKEDNMYGLLDNYYFHELNNQAMYEDYVKEIPKITIKDIQKLAKKMKEIYEYILKEDQDGTD